jgi:hypothetical protein
MDANSREFVNADRMETTEHTEEHGNGGFYASIGVPLCAFALKQFASIRVIRGHLCASLIREKAWLDHKALLNYCGCRESDGYS